MPGRRARGQEPSSSSSSSALPAPESQLAPVKRQKLRGKGETQQTLASDISLIDATSTAGILSLQTSSYFPPLSEHVDRVVKNEPHFVLTSEKQSSKIKELKENDEEDDDDDEVWEEVDASIATSHEMPSTGSIEIVIPGKVPGPKVGSQKVSKEDRDERIILHKAHLCLLITAALHRTRWTSQNPDLQAVALSLIPQDILESLWGKWDKTTKAQPSHSRIALKGKKALTESSEIDFLKALKCFTTWWARTFSSVQTAEPDVLDVQAVLDAGSAQAYRPIPAHKNTLSPCISAILFSSACEALGIPCRLITSIHPVPLSLAKSTGLPREKLASPKHVPFYPLRHWCEVQIPESALSKKPENSSADLIWLCIDPNLNIIGDPFKFDAPSNANHQVRLAYVLAFGDFWEDLTMKYTTNSLATQKLRIKLTPEEDEDGWLDLFMETFHPFPAAGGAGDGKPGSGTPPPIPTSFKDFKNNDFYALDYNLNVNQIIYPRGIEHAIGSFREYKVYPRSHLKMAQAMEAWKREGRCIKIGEEPLYYRMDPKSKKKMLVIKEPSVEENKNDDGEDDEEGIKDGDLVPSNYYGIWQTEPIQPDPIQNGVIPKNSFGNFELFHPCMLPAGARHLDVKGIARIAKKMPGIDFADAMLGFEWHRGRATPAVRGIVVAEEHADAILAAYEEEMAKQMEKERKKREKAVLARWKRLIQGALIRSRLMDKYHG